MQEFTKPVVCFGCSATYDKLAYRLSGPCGDSTASQVALVVHESRSQNLVPFCHPSCVLQSLQSGKLEVGQVDLEDYFQYLDDATWVQPVRDLIRCVTCKGSSHTPTWVIASAPWGACMPGGSRIQEWDEPGCYIPGGVFCSLGCFREGMRAEVVHFETGNLGKWYEHVPFGEQQDVIQMIRRPTKLEPSTSKSRKFGRKEERLPASRILTMI